MKNLLLICVLALWNAIALHAQNIHFNHIGTSDGFSHFAITQVYVDENGLVWCGTRMGLNCWDGSSVLIYTYKSHDPHSLLNNTIQKLAGDGNGHLFVKCIGGLTEMDLKTRKFTTLHKGDIGALVYDGALYYSIGNKLFMQQRNARPRVVATLPRFVTISCMKKDRLGRLWIGTEHSGVYLSTNGHVRQVMARGAIESLYEDRQRRIWVGTQEEGCTIIMPNGKMIQHGMADGWGSNFVRTFCQDKHGDMWLGTSDGLFCWKGGDTKPILMRPGNDRGQIGDDNILSITKDPQGTLWIGTYFGGLYFMNPSNQILTHYTASEGGSVTTLTNKVVGRMTEDDNGRLWICTEGGGLNGLNLATHTFVKPIFFPTKNETSLNLKAIYYQRNSRTLWMGSQLGGMAAHNLKTGVTTVFRARKGDPHSLPSDIVRDIVGYGNDIVVGTQNGVALLHTATGMFTQLMPKQDIDYVTSIIIDAQHNLWVATEGKGLWIYNLRSRKTKHISATSKDDHGLGTDNLNHLMIDRKGDLWIATSGNGLLRFNKQTKRFESYGPGQHLFGGSVYTVVPSHLSVDRLLVVTNRGFSVFDTKEKVFHNFSTLNGFPLSTTNEQALFITRQGVVCIGSVDGLFCFDERQLFQQRPTFNILFTRLTVNGKEVEPGDKTGILQTALPYQNSITLDNSQRTFAVRVAATNSIDGNGGEMLYRLKGYQNEWTRMPGPMRLLSFTGLSSGRYTLELKSTVPGVASRSLEITILPPWYFSWWAIIGYIIIAALLIRQRMRNINRRIELREQLKYQRDHMKYIEQMNRQKVELFTNISHEIRTPLTVIVALGESLINTEHFPANVYNKVLGIYKNSTQLRNLITELLDFRKQEEGKMKLQAVGADFPTFVRQTSMLFREYAQTISVKLVVEPGDGFQLWFDKSLMLKVLNNLLSNALKNTPKGGQVKVSVNKTDTEAILTVENTGDGIPVEEVKKIFENFYQTEQFKSLRPGTGIGLSLSKSIVTAHHGTIDVESHKDEGACFTVRLPLGESHLKPEEKLDNPDSNIIDDLDADLQPMLVGEEAREENEEDEEKKSLMLVVEDNPSIRELLVQVLSPHFRVETAVDGRDGLNKTRELKPDIVLSDILMPNMSGTELCRTIKRDFKLCDIPVVLLTARTDDEMSIEGLKMGADDYITKPFKTSLLISRCNNVVNTRRVLQRKYAKQGEENVDLVANNMLAKKMMEEGMAIIESKYTNPNFTVDDFALQMGMSRTALFSKWKQLTGDTPKSFILTLRLRKAAEMLRAQPQLSISEVSYNNGFSSPKYFCKCFKAYYHLQPTAYRKGENPEDADDKNAAQDKELEDENT